MCSSSFPPRHGPSFISRTGFSNPASRRFASSFAFYGGEGSAFPRLVWIVSKFLHATQRIEHSHCSWAGAEFCFLVPGVRRGTSGTGDDDGASRG